MPLVCFSPNLSWSVQMQSIMYSLPCHHHDAILNMHLQAWSDLGLLQSSAARLRVSACSLPMFAMFLRHSETGASHFIPQRISNHFDKEHNISSHLITSYLNASQRISMHLNATKTLKLCPSLIICRTFFLEVIPHAATRPAKSQGLQGSVESPNLCHLDPLGPFLAAIKPLATWTFQWQSPGKWKHSAKLQAAWVNEHFL